MEWNYVLIWVVLINTSIMLAMNVKQRLWGWVGVCAGVIGLVVVLLLTAPRIAGLVGGACFLLFLLLPALFSWQVIRAMMRQEYARAARLAGMLRCLHPFDGWWSQPALLWGLEYAQRGDLARAEAILEQFQHQPNAFGKSARMQLYRLRGTWEECVQWVDDSPAVLGNYYALISLYCRGLGEIGALHRLIDYINVHKAFLKVNGHATYAQTLLFVFSFCGHATGVEQALASGLLVHLPEPLKEYWRLNAAMAAGDVLARERLAALSSCGDKMLQRAITQRLSRPMVLATETLSVDDRRALDELYQEFAGEARYQLTQTAGKSPVATYALIASCLVMFGVEIACHGINNTSVLYHLGAGFPYAILHQGQWWRLLTPIFLHVNSTHLVMNLLGLFIWGRILEPKLGSGRVMLVFFIAGVGAQVVTTLCDPHSRFISIGASGAIMGFIGAYLGFALAGWWREKVTLASKQIRLILALIALQTTFDLLTPHVNMIAHLSGVAIGFLLALLFSRSTRITPSLPH